MPTNGQFIRQRLVEAGSKGVVIADLHKERKEHHLELGITYKGGTYSSFVRLFRWLIDLGWVEQTGETEAAFAKGDTYELKSPRIYYRITPEGLARSETDWYDPIAAALPEWTGSLRRVKYVLPTGRPRGRPRIGPPVVKKPPRLPKVRKPRVKKVEVELTEEEKERVVREGIGILKEAAKRTGRIYREPTRAEIYEWFLEELKLKQRKEREEKG